MIVFVIRLMVNMYYLTSMIILLYWTLFTLAVYGQVPVPSQQQQNAGFITGRTQIIMGIMGIGTNASTNHYTSALINNAATISTVYYSTYEIDVPLWSQNDPFDSSKDNLWYQIEQVNSSATQLTTSIQGYLYNPQINFIGFNYLIVLTSWPFSNYVTITTIVFQRSGSTVFTTQLINIPTYSSGSATLSILRFLRDIKLEYLHSAFDSYNRRIYFEVTCSWTTQISCTLSRNNLLDHMDTIVKIRYLMVVYYSETIQSLFPKYTFDSQSIGPYDPRSFNVNISHPYSTFMFGLGRIEMYCNGDPSWKYGLLIDSNLSTYQGIFYGNYSSALFLAWATKYVECPSSYYTFNNFNKTCTLALSCTSAQYYDAPNNVCAACISPCDECYSITDCKTCVPALNRVLSNLRCVPDAGFYQNNASVIYACNAVCASCSMAADNCTSCPANTYLVNYSCLECYDLIQGCSLCNGTKCYTCNSSYHWVNHTYCSITCADPHCQACSNSNATICLQCYKPYLLVYGNCNDPCGNAVLMPQEQCDDGNLDPHDGCDQLCQVQQNYNCTNATSIANYSFTAYCSYLAPVNFSIITIEKLSEKNALRIVISVQQYEESFWIDHQTFGKHVSFNVSHLNVEAQFIGEWFFSDSRRLLAQDSRQLLEVRAGTYPSGQLVAVEFEYQQSLQDEIVDMTLDFGRNRDPRVNTIPAETVSFQATPENNQLAYVYSDETYEQWSLVRNCLLFICIAYFVLYLLTLFLGNKRIIAEGTMVVQAAYAALAACPSLSPLFSAVTALSMSHNPYNVMYSQSFRPFDDPLLPDRLRGTNLYAFFLYNFNSGMLFIVVPLIIGIVLFLVSKCWCIGELRQERVAKAAQFSLGEYCLSGIVMMGCAIAVASCLEVRFGMADLNEGMMSVVAMSIMLFLLLIYVLVWTRWSHLFGEYYQTLEPECSCAVFYLFYFALGPAAGLIHYILYSYSFSSGLVIVYALVLFIVLLVKPVFKKARDRIRVQINLITVVLTQLPFLFGKTMMRSSSSLANTLQILVPLAVPVFLGVNLLVNLSVLIYLTIIKIREWFYHKQSEKAGEELKKQEEQQHAVQHNQQIIKLYNRTLNTPLQTIVSKPTSPKVYRTRFIDPQREEVNQKQMMFRKDIDQFLAKEHNQAKERIKANQESPLNSSGEQMIGSKRKRRRMKYTGEDYKVRQEYENIGQL